jgi:SAM-dependent methyltransferase
VEDRISGLADLNGTVDVVTFFQVLEHLNSPAESLEQAAALLRPGGMVLLETWDYGSAIAHVTGRRWQQLSPPSVVTVMNRHSAGVLMARCGFRLTEWRRTSKTVSVRMVIGQSVSRLPRPVARVAELGSDVLGGVKLRYGLGDLISASAVLA